LSLIDDDDMTWVNGTLVGQTWGWTIPRVYSIPAGVLHPGQNTIAVRVQDGLANGGMLGDAEAIRLETASASIPLTGTWKFRIGKLVLNQDGRANQLPTLLYNKMIHPLLPFPVAGFLWYQGESNTGGEDAVKYAGQFSSLISNWRTVWGFAEAPFLFVQLASFHPALPDPSDSDWATLRASQSAALALPDVGQVITIDIGEADDIHPRNKQDVGHRLALAARHIAYGEDVVHSGPTYRDHRVEADRVIIDFDHVGSGLVARGSELGGFAIAGSDGRFIWADARIAGNSVIVSSESIADPTAVRYAWADNPDRANLYNEEGLPAAPFRTSQ
jgi:sialate O-acetylesterase